MVFLSRLRSSRATNGFRNLWPVALYGLTVVVLTWPALPRVKRAIPQGSERSTTVPLFSLWILGWNVDRIEGGFRDYWDAPIFHPAADTFAFSEPQPLAGLMAFPFWFLGPGPAYNAVLLGYMLLNGLAAFALLKRRGVDPLPSFLGGVLILFLPFLTQERGVLPLLPIFGPLLALGGLWTMAERPGWRTGLALCLGIVFTTFTNGSYGLFLGLILPLALPWVLLRSRTGRAWLWIAAGLLLAAAVVAPVALHQMAALEAMGFGRSLATIGRNSAGLADYLRPPSQIWESAWFPFHYQGSQRLFPGFMLIAMALAGAIAGLRQPQHRAWTLYLLAMTVLVFGLSFGPNLVLGGWRPYTLLATLVPGFEQLRSPFRLALFVQIGLALLSALFLSRAWSSGRRVAVLAVVAVTLVELFPRPARLAPLPEPFDFKLPDGPAVFLPWPESGSVKAHEETASWMVSTMGDPVPLANGYSSNFPGITRQLRSLLAGFPSPDSLAALRAIGVETIIARADWLIGDRVDRMAEAISAGDLRPIGEEQGLQLYRLFGSRLASAQSFQGAWDHEIALTEQALEIWVKAEVPDDRFFVVTPEVAPLNWTAALTGPDASQKRHPVSPRGALLQYRDNRRRLVVSIPLPARSGDYDLGVFDVETGRQILATAVTIP